MKFKTFVFLNIFILFLFTGCDSNDTNNKINNAKEENNNNFDNKIRNKIKLETTDKKILRAYVKNEKIIFNDYEDKIILLNFFATWCPPCRAEIPNLVKLQEEFKNEFIIISVLLEDSKANDELEDFINKFKINYIVTNSPNNFDFAKKIGGLKYIPTMILLDKEGNIFQKYTGLIPYEMLEIDIKKALSK